MTKTVFAHTPFVADFPPFVNLSRKEDGSYALTVRSHGNGGRGLGTIQLSAKTVEALAYGALADLCQESADPVVNGPFASQVTLHVVDPGPDSLERVVAKHSDDRVGKTGATLAEHDALTGLALRGIESMSGPDSMEREIQAKADKGPRVTPAALQAEIASAHYFTGFDGAAGAAYNKASPDGVLREFSFEAPPALSLLTFCVLVLRNGFTVHGVSACASPENYNEEIGQRIARENAERQIWPLLGFRLRDELARPVLTEADALADLAGEPRPY